MVFLQGRKDQIAEGKKRNGKKGEVGEDGKGRDIIKCRARATSGRGFGLPLTLWGFQR